MNRRIISLAGLTFKEGIRDRAIYGIGLFALMMMAFSMIIVSFFMRELYKVTVDINISAITFAGLLLTFSLSVNLMAKDMDKRTIYCVLSKPFSRSEYLLGKFFGMVMLNLAALGVLTLVSTLNVWLIQSMYPNYFKAFVWSGFFQAIFSEFLMFIVLNAMVVFYSTVSTSSFITLLFTISTYIAGQTIEEVVLYIKSQANSLDLSQSVQWVIQISQYILPNLSVFDIKIKAAHGLSISLIYLLSITAYSLIYSAVLLLLASMIFRRRELT
jgi:ABC-type transport system involved in multi-copper enzyme maturation permease subunit